MYCFLLFDERIWMSKGAVLIGYFESWAAAAYCKEILGLLDVKDSFLLSNVDVQVEILGDLVAAMGFFGLGIAACS